MRDPRQNNDTIYYQSYQVQQTDGNQLRDVEERHGELKQLENQIVQLGGIHRDFADLVSNHHELIDNIDVHVIKTEQQVVAGNNSLAKAVELQSAARRKKIFCGALCFIITILAIVIGVVIYLTKKSK
ncbi:hypothetical protein I4U23_017860 [Adineta vaga]|nr:hypothetical protein I4U23_017860 [Adineta vaga]